jgi:hypothetical protein
MADAFKLAIKADQLAQFIQSVPFNHDKNKVWRHADIQIDKLRRMADKFNKEFPAAATANQRRQGVQGRLLSEQGKRTDLAIQDLVAQWFYVASRKRILVAPAPTKKEAQEVGRKAVKVLNLNIHNVAKQLRLSATTEVIKDLPGFRNVGRLGK